MCSTTAAIRNGRLAKPEPARGMMIWPAYAALRRGSHHPLLRRGRRLEWQDFHLRPPGPKPGALKTELRSVKVVSAGRLALPLPPFRTENVAATPRAVCPGDSEGAGGLVRLDPDSGILETRPGGEWRIRRDLHPQPSRRQRVAPLVELRIHKLVGGAGNAPVVASG